MGSGVMGDGIWWEVGSGVRGWDLGWWGKGDGIWCDGG